MCRVFEDPGKVHNKTPINLLQQDFINIREENVTNITEVQYSTSETADPTLHAGKTAKLKRVGHGKRFIIQTYFNNPMFLVMTMPFNCFFITIAYDICT